MDNHRSSARVEGGGEPAHFTPQDRTLYQVRVPVVFDHLNGDLREELNRQKVRLLQALGRGAAIVEVGGIRFGKFEVWFEFDDDPAPTGRQHAQTQALGTTQTALEHIGLAPTGDERGLCVVGGQVVTTPVVARPDSARR